MTPEVAEEPLSGRVARAKGCPYGGRPICPWDNCPGFAHRGPAFSHGKMEQRFELMNYLLPEEAFNLLAEMAAGGAHIEIVDGDMFYWPEKIGISFASVAGEFSPPIVAACWLAWKGPSS